MRNALVYTNGQGGAPGPRSLKPGLARNPAPPTRDYKPELPEHMAQSILSALAEDPAAPAERRRACGRIGALVTLLPAMWPDACCRSKRLTDTQYSGSQNG